MKLHAYYLLLCQLFTVAIGLAQFNLIPDSSFENNKFIPLDYSSLDANAYWSSPSRATTDLFCTCRKKDKKISRVNVPANSMGIQEARSGKCYAGFFAFSHGYYREYLQTPLAQPLQAGKEYDLTFYISLSDYSRLAIDRLGVCFLNNTKKYEHSDVITDLRPQYVSLEDAVGLDVNEWNQVTVRYKARGGEAFVLIGSFALKRVWQTGSVVPPTLSTPINKKIERDAYYYIDDVSLYEYKPEPLEQPVVIEVPDQPGDQDTSDRPEVVYVEPQTIEKLPTETVVTFQHLLFKSGEADINPSSYPELNVIATYMKADPALRIEIYGHTDNAGDEEKNKELSFKRAEAVGAYLKAKGVSYGNIFSQGFGSSKPVDTNDTPEGRKRNRRVEFILK